MTSLSPYSIYSMLDLKALSDRASVMRLARNAERAERYHDVLMCLKHIVKIAPDQLNVEERDFLCATYGRLIGTVRASWLSLSSNLENAQEDDVVLHTRHSELLMNYKSQLEEEVQEICEDALATFTTLLERCKGSSDSLSQDAIETRVVYKQSLGDYHRYQAEILSDDAAGETAAMHYKAALKLAESEAKLDSTHPILLTVVLNYSVCLNDTIRDTKQACLLSKEAFDQAIPKLDDAEDAACKDTRLILQLIRDNLVLWADTRKA